MTEQEQHARTIRIELWENLSAEQQAATEKKWEDEGRKVTEDHRSSYFKGQELLKHMMGLEPSEYRTLPPSQPGEKAVLPQTQGYYMWYILDWDYLDVGVVQIMKDTMKHLEYLKAKAKDGCNTFIMYQNEAGETLTMYHQAHDHYPPMNGDGVPCVDGYVPFCFDILR